MVTSRQIAEIARVVELAGLSEATLQRLRSAFPGMHFTHCHDDDVVGVEPAAQLERANVYLVDGRSHCLALTDDLQRATGVVLADVS